MTDVNNQQCQCEICQLSRRYSAQGVPEEVVYVYCQVVINDPKYDHDSGSERLAAVDGLCAQWLLKYQMAQAAIHEGVFIQSEIEAAMQDPAAFERLTAKLDAYMARKVN